MFDYVECEIDLPDGVKPEDLAYSFQTKAFDNVMTTFRITKEGRLFFSDMEWERVGEYDPGWTKPKGTKIPKYEVVKEDWVEWHTNRGTPFHGEFNFYTSTEDGIWHEYTAIFNHGQLEAIVVDQEANKLLNQRIKKIKSLDSEDDTQSS